MNNTKVKLDYILNSTDDLPQFPLIAMQIFNLCSDPDTEHEELEKLIKSDAGLVTRLFRLVNSSKFGFSKNVVTIPQTISILGLNGIKEAVMLSSISRVFHGKAGEVLWKQSIAASIAAQEMFNYYHKPLSETQFLSTLLHNIGRAILIENFQEEYMKFLELRFYDELLRKEEAFFGKNHREIGASLAEKWGLPQNIIDGIKGNYDVIGDDHMLKTSLELTYLTLDDVANDYEYSSFKQLKETIIKKTEEQIEALGN